MSDGCGRCGSRQVNEGHDAACALVWATRRRAVQYAAGVGVGEVAAVDLWAHLRSGARQLGRGLTAMEAEAVVGLVLDLGWRPVVGQAPELGAEVPA